MTLAALPSIGPGGSPHAVRNRPLEWVNTEQEAEWDPPSPRKGCSSRKLLT